MLILLSCPKEELKNLMSVYWLINIIKIVIPILLIVYSIFKILKSKELTKTLIIHFILNMLLSLLIFISPNIIYLINNYVNNDKISCMSVIDKNVIKIMNILNKDNVTRDDYVTANNYYNEIKSEVIKNELENDIEDLKYISGYEDASIKINELINLYKENFSNEDYNKILNLYTKIKDNNEKDILKNEIDNIKKYDDIISNINILASNYDKARYQEILKVISDISDENIKQKLSDKLSASRNIPKLNISTGVTLKKYEGIYTMPYVEAIPENATEEMPLIIYLHGDWGGGYEEKLTELTDEIYENITKKTKEKFIFIAPTVEGYGTGGSGNWESPQLIKSLKNLIDTVISEYKIDNKRVTIMGHSRGAIGVWNIVGEYPDFFQIAIPVSCRATVFKKESFKNTIVWAFAGNDGGTETAYANTMRDYVNQINAIGGNAKFTQYKKIHSDMADVLLSIDLYNWILDQ